MDVFGKGFDMHQGRDSTRHPRRFPSAARNTHAARSTQASQRAARRQKRLKEGWFVAVEAFNECMFSYGLSMISTICTIKVGC
jgi:hypothetical protein